MTATDSANHDPFATARTWQALVSDEVHRSRRTAWRVAAAAVAVALLTTTALCVALATSEVRVGLLYVDRDDPQGRWVQVGKTATVEQTEILDKHWVAAYLMARETYHWGTLQTSYDTVVAMSEGDAERTYKEAYSANNPVALDKQLGNSIERRPRILSITLPPGEAGRAVARIERTTYRNGGALPPERFVVTLAYGYKPATAFGQKLRERSAVLNPLGFKASAYRIDAEFSARPGTAASAAGANP
jgi:type IV secretion system protein VirB8